MIFVGEVSVSLLKKFLCRNKQLKEKIAELKQEKADILKEYQEASGAWKFYASYSAIPIEEVPVGSYSFDHVIGEGERTYFALERYSMRCRRKILVQGDIFREDKRPSLERPFGSAIFIVAEDEAGVRHYSMQILDEVKVYSPKY